MNKHGLNKHSLTKRVQVSTDSQLKEALSNDSWEYVYVPQQLLSQETPCKDRIIVVPPVFKCDSLREFGDMGYSRALAHTIGHIPVIKEAKMLPHGGLRLNVTNSLALKQYEDLGLVDSILSIEMSLVRMKSVNSALPKGFIAYGRLPLMLLRKYPNSDGLVDRKGKFIPIVKGVNEAELLNPDKLVLDRIEDFSGLDFAVSLLSKDDNTKNITRGLYYK